MSSQLKMKMRASVGLAITKKVTEKCVVGIEQSSELTRRRVERGFANAQQMQSWAQSFAL